MATQAKCDYYEILSVTRIATPQDISDAFEKLAAELKTAGKPSNIQDVERIREVVTAYRVLSDDKKRARYDQTGQGLIGADDNKLAGTGRDKLDDLLEWIEDRRSQQSSGADYLS